MPKKIVKIPEERIKKLSFRDCQMLRSCWPGYLKASSRAFEAMKEILGEPSIEVVTQVGDSDPEASVAYAIGGGIACAGGLGAAGAAGWSLKTAAATTTVTEVAVKGTTSASAAAGTTLALTAGIAAIVIGGIAIGYYIYNKNGEVEVISTKDELKLSDETIKHLDASIENEIENRFGEEMKIEKAQREEIFNEELATYKKKAEDDLNKMIKAKDKAYANLERKNKRKIAQMEENFIKLVNDHNEEIAKIKKDLENKFEEDLKEFGKKKDEEWEKKLDEKLEEQRLYFENKMAEQDQKWQEKYSKQQKDFDEEKKEILEKNKKEVEAAYNKGREESKEIIKEQKQEIEQLKNKVESLEKKIDQNNNVIARLVTLCEERLPPADSQKTLISTQDSELVS